MWRPCIRVESIRVEYVQFRGTLAYFGTINIGQQPPSVFEKKYVVSTAETSLIRVL